MIRLFLLLTITTLLAHADQSADAAVTWHYALSNPTPAAGETIELIITAKLPPHHILYSSDFKADIGPQPTEFVFKSTAAVVPAGSVRAINPKKKQDRTWDTEFTYFETAAEFRQPLRIAQPSFTLRGTIKGQLCNEQDGTCTLFEEPVNIVIR